MALELLRLAGSSRVTIDGGGNVEGSREFQSDGGVTDEACRAFQIDN